MTSILRCASMLLACALLCFTGAQGQGRSRGNATAGDSDSQSDSNRSSPLGSPHQEMLMRSIIARNENAHRANLQRARESAEWAAELRAAYESSRALSRDDMRKLERMERNIRRIRSEAGGSDGDTQMSERPATLEAALKHLAEASEALRKDVESTSRFVVSASIIERANDLIELIRLARAYAR